MDDAQFEAQKDRIRALIDKWHAPLGLKWWTIEHEYARSFDEMPSDDANIDSLARCYVHWQYLRARVVWNLDNAKDCDDEYLERAFVHECMHILVNEMRFDEKNLDHEERVCTVLANAIMWTREMALNEHTFIINRSDKAVG